MPASTAAHLPSIWPVFAAMQDKHFPVHALSQQVPSTQ
jgi:hypothetical protein